MAPEIEFCLLGPLAVRKDGQAVPCVAPKQRVVLAALLLRPGRIVTLDELAGMVWGPEPPASARVTLQNYARRLRLALGDSSRSRIATMSQGYLLNIGDGELDVTRFEALQREAREAARLGGWERAAGLLDSALALWRGEPLTDVPSDLLLSREVPRLTEMHARAVEARIDADLHLGRHGQVIAQLRQLTAAHPLRERLHGMLMLALYRDGRQGEACATYADARRLLVSELGIEPGPELRDLHQRILRADPGLMPRGHPRDAAEPAEPATAVATAALAQQVPGGHHAADPAPGRPARSPVVPRQLPAAIRHFAGRQDELKTLFQLLDDANVASSEMDTVVISAIGGTAGIGKTALALHFAHQVADRFPDGQLYVNLRGFDPSGTPLQPAEAVRGFLDGLGIAAERIPAGIEAQAALYRSLLAARRMLIVLDNAHDTGHVRPLLPGSSGCLVVITSRSQLTGLVAADTAYPIRLDVLTEADALDLMTGRLGAKRVRAEPEAANELIRLCAGLPLALSIVAARAAAHPGFPLKALASELGDTRGRLDVLDGGDAGTNVRAVFSWSYRKLPPPAARMFRLLGIHPGPDISTAAAASLAALSASQARQALGELTRFGLLAEHAPGRYTFHDLLRAYATEQAHAAETSDDTRAAVHRALEHYLHTAHRAAILVNPARAPLALRPPPPGVTPEDIATDGAALAWFQAEQHVLIAIVGQAANADFDACAWQLPWALADFFDWHGHWQDLASTQRIALMAAERLGDTQGQADAHREIGRACALLGAHEDAHAHLSRALHLCGQTGDEAGQARAHAALSWVCERQGNHDRALGHGMNALALYRSAGNKSGEATELNAVGWDYALLGNFAKALSHCQEALALHRESGNRYEQAATLDSLGYIHSRLGHYAEAVDCLGQALGLCAELGDRYHLAEILTHLGEAHRADGRVPQARDAWKQAVSILDELHHPDADEVRAKLAGLLREREDSGSARTR
ncbi:MAG: AfsR/SARP family transcriptional regulator [Micromonosporaceae bacterium]